MKKSRTPGEIVLLIFATLFVIGAVVCLFFDVLSTIGSFNAIFGPDSDGWDALGGVFLFLYTIILSIAAGAFSLVSIPFSIALNKKYQPTGYRKALLIAAIIVIVFAILMVFSLPIASHIAPDGSSSSSLSSSI